MKETLVLLGGLMAPRALCERFMGYEYLYASLGIEDRTVQPVA